MRFGLLIIIACAFLSGHAQKKDSLPSFTFAKKTTIFTIPDPTVFGKGWYAYNTSYFMDNSLRLNNRTYLKCGPYFKKFERYCVEKGLPCDSLLLPQFRKKLVPANIVYYSSIPTAFIPFARAINSPSANPGKAIFIENYNYLFWALVVAEIVVGVEVKAKAERRFNAAMKKRWLE